MTQDFSKPQASYQMFLDRDYQVIDHGVQGEQAAISALNNSYSHGILLAALSGSVWPHNNEKLVQDVCDQIIRELIAFSIHSRRFLEIKKIRNLKIKGALLVMSPDARDCEYETDLCAAINRIIHAREIRIFTVECESSRFSSMGDRRIAHARVQSDKGDAILVCPSALFYSYFAVQNANS